MDRCCFLLCFIPLFAAPELRSDDGPPGVERAFLIVRRSVTNPSLESVTLDSVYIDRYGDREARHSHEIQSIKMLGTNREIRSVLLVEDGWITTYDPLTRKGTKRSAMISGASALPSDSAAADSSRGSIPDITAETVTLEPEDVAGKPCDVTMTTVRAGAQETRTKTWTWKGIVLKSISNALDTETTEETIRVEEGTEIPPDWLVIPPDVEITEVGTGE